MALRHTLPAVPSQAPRLITIPISHYCEKARWALERAEIPYREEPTCRRSTGRTSGARAAAAPRRCS